MIQIININTIFGGRLWIYLVQNVVKKPENILECLKQELRKRRV